MNPKRIKVMLDQPSTWRGLASVAACFGLVFQPDQIAAIAAAWAGVSGAIGAFIDDSKE